MNRDFPQPPALRAPRYPIRITVRYRSTGQPDWYEGVTENISRSGVLIRSNYVMATRTPIEMLLALPVEVGGGENATVICRGRVVRTEPPAPDDPRPAIAATIADYHLTHSQGADPRRI